ncbi:long-chain fatty acid--CoA ligase, partial [Micrococcus endophyticus]
MREISEPYHPRLSPESNITDFLERQADERPDHGLFAVADEQDQWTDVSARDARERVRALAK